MLWVTRATENKAHRRVHPRLVVVESGWQPPSVPPQSLVSERKTPVSLELGNMTFRRFGRTYHLRIRSADDLRQVLELSEAHWVAVSAPIDTIHCDSVFLELLDADHDGRIRPHEL